MSVLSRIGKCRRLLSWTAFALFLAGFGWALNAWLPPHPRWVREWTFNEVVFAPNGARVLVSGRHGPLMQLWDVATGKVQATHGEGARLLGPEAVSPDFRWWAALVSPKEKDAVALRLLMIDLASGEERQSALVLENGEEVNARGLAFAPSGGVFALQTWLPERPPGERLQGHTIFYDAASGRPRGQWQRSQIRSGFTADGRYYVGGYLGDDAFNLGAWDVVAAEALPSLLAGGWSHSRSPAGAQVACAVEAAEKRCIVWLWDLQAGRQQTLGAERPACMPWFSPDGRLVVLVPLSWHGPVEVWEVNPVRKRGELAVAAQGGPTFALDCRHIFLHTKGSDSTPHMVVADLENVQQLWDRPWLGDLRHTAYFTADSSTLTVTDSEARFEIYETRTGAVRAAPNPFGATPDNWTEWGNTVIHGPYLLLCAAPQNADLPAAAPPGPVWWQTLRESLLGSTDEPAPMFTVAVIDTRDGKVAFRIQDRTLSAEIGLGEFARLSPDGRALLTVHRRGDSHEMRCYDVPVTKPWPWIGGVPLALGVLLLSLLVGWRRLRRTSAPIIAAATPNAATT